MTNFIAVFVVVRVLLPLFLLGACLFRFNLLSASYSLFLLTSPFLQVSKKKPVPGGTKAFLIILVALSGIYLLGHIAFQGYLLGTRDLALNHTYGWQLPNCSVKEEVFRNIGFQRYNFLPFWDIIRLLVPDISTFIFTIVAVALCSKYQPAVPPVAGEDLTASASVVLKRVSYKRRYYLNVLGQTVTVLILGTTGLMHPSAVSGIYFLSFLYIATWVACYKSLGAKFAVYRAVIMTISGIHILVLYLYQFSFFQEVLSPKSLTARILGLTALVITHCDIPNPAELHMAIGIEGSWPRYVSPAIIFLLYWVLATETRRWCAQVDSGAKLEPYAPPNLNTAEARSGFRRFTASRDSDRQVLKREGDVHSAEELELMPPVLITSGEETPNYQSIEERPLAEQQSPDEQATPSGDENERHLRKRNPFVTIGEFILRQSYIATLIVMMAWSITYHCWLTFVLLLAACIIWMIPDPRRTCRALSPLLVAYALALLIIQYIYGLQLNDDELPNKFNAGFNLQEIGFRKERKQPCIVLAVQIGFTLFIWLNLRQNMQDKHNKHELAVQQAGVPLLTVVSDDPPPAGGTKRFRRSLSEETRSVDNPKLVKIGAIGWEMLTKYWIFVCVAMFLMMSLQDVVAYRIIYMGFFLYFCITFQVYYRWWRFQLLVFWWLVIIFSMIVLCMIYTYQFTDFQNYWHNTGMSNESIRDIGLEKYDTGALFQKLLAPTAFIIIVILQVNYFHQSFMKISSLKYRPGGENSDGNGEGLEGRDRTSSALTESTRADTTISWKSSLSSLVRMRAFTQDAEKFVKFVVGHSSRIWSLVSWIIWRICELHIFKIVAFTILMVAVTEVTAVNMILLLMLLVLIPFKSLRPLMSVFCMLWASVLILAKMIYQIDLVPNNFWKSNCTNRTDYPFNQTVDNAIWVGLKKTDKLRPIAPYLCSLVILVLVLGFERIIKLHQKQQSTDPDIPQPREGIIFPDTRREDADKDFTSCLKFLANYFFYKFGLETCLIMISVNIVIRSDVYAVIYAIILGIFLVVKRRTCARLWAVYIVFLILVIIVQYSNCLGLLPRLCLQYPWASWVILGERAKGIIMEQWLYLADYDETKQPSAFLIIADFFQLLFACLQWRVFRIENSSSWIQYGGGDNTPLTGDIDETQPNPVKDFLTSKMSILDYCKVVLFFHMFWVTLAAIFITALQRINIFCLGYMVGCFIILWFGQNLLLKPRSKLLHVWNVILGYNYFVILARAFLLVIGCLYYRNLHIDYCVLQELFTIVCNSVAANVAGNPDDFKCSDPPSGSIGWDVVCLVFILLQRRAYSSNYFRHVVIGLRVQNKLANRGAQLINGNLVKDVMEYKHKEKIHLLKIRRKMELIKKKQEKLNLKSYDDHYKTIRLGDYYMFEDVDEVDEDEFWDEQGEGDSPAAGPLQVLNAALEGGTSAALGLKKKSTVDWPGERRRTISSASDSGVTPESPSVPPVEPTIPDEDETKSSDDTEGKKTDRADSKTDEDKIIKDGADEDTEEDVEDEDDEGCWSKTKSGILFVWKLFVSLLESLIAMLNEVSFHYRQVAVQLEIEYQQEKENMRERLRNGEAEPDEYVPPDLTDSSDQDQTDGTVSRSPAHDIGLDMDDIHVESDEEDAANSNLIFRLVKAFYNAAISRSELVCYFIIVLNQMSAASLLSIPLPLSVFLWAMLSVPRPSKRFWTTIITYLMALIVIKYLFQFNFIKWETETKAGDKPTYIALIGIEQRDDFATYDLVTLLFIFIHRSILKRYGLWKDVSDAQAEMEAVQDAHKNAKASLDELDSSKQQIEPVTTETSLATVQSESELAITSEEDGDKAVDSDETDEQQEGTLKRCCWEPVRSLGKFYKRLTAGKFCRRVDVYTAMFLCDIITFLIVTLGYGWFGPASQGEQGDVSSYLSENRIPAPFLAMLLIQFILIIIDRALYLRKFVLGKFVFQVLLVIVVHCWIFFVLPVITAREFGANIGAKLWYFTKCIYFALSAYQIRCGYPTRILGNILTQSYSLLNKLLFKGFLAIPFILEIRMLMDWMWTDTCLDLLSWMQMEDIFNSLFVVKCERVLEDKFPTPSGYRRTSLIKWLVGGLQLILILFIIWFPLLLFSFSNTISSPFPPTDCTVQISIGGYQPIFKMSAQQQLISVVDKNCKEEIFKKYTNKGANKAGVGFLSNYETVDMRWIHIPGNSTATWGISPPSQRAMVLDLRNKKNNIDLFFTAKFSRDSAQSADAAVVATYTLKKTLKSTGSDMELRGRLANITNYILPDLVAIRQFFPRFMRLRTNGQVLPVNSLSQSSGGGDTDGYSSIWVQLLKGNYSSLDREDEWWRIREENTKAVCGQKKGNSSMLNIVAFSDRAAPQVLSFLPGKGTIIGLYISFILVIGTLIRGWFTGLKEDVKYRQMPYVDRNLELCFNIYLARESKDLYLEEELYAKLLFLYRSPETMIAYSKYPKEKED
ncbi:piezo-type mechanosensitive ion channel component 1-like isoform X3 [Tubulanus polymorphus]|uniref:piezo-type mechanosensitive ion channel component 1-like isoform X3 n=1 Tax=Tubulanus polymorphus TaxID=672921 RepID=UPI003DA61E5E